MRSIWRTLDRSLLRDVLTIAGTASMIGLSFGAIAAGAGLPWWQPPLMSVLVFAGGAQFMMVGVVAAGGGPLTAAFGALVLNARHLPFGMALGPVLGERLSTRLVGSHLMVDESVAFAMAQRDPGRAKAAYWACGVALFVAWNLGTLAGAFAGTVIGDPDAFGLDAAFPAALLALILPSLRHRTTLLAAVLGSTIALATTPLLPPGVPVLLALLGVIVAWRRRPAPRRGAVEEVSSP